MPSNQSCSTASLISHYVGKAQRGLFQIANKPLAEIPWKGKGFIQKPRNLSN